MRLQYCLLNCTNVPVLGTISYSATGVPPTGSRRLQVQVNGKTTVSISTVLTSTRGVPAPAPLELPPSPPLLPELTPVKHRIGYGNVSSNQSARHEVPPTNRPSLQQRLPVLPTSNQFIALCVKPFDRPEGEGEGVEAFRGET